MNDSDRGPGIDPNGPDNGLGARIDDNGLTSEGVVGLDPDGATADLGSAVEPNGSAVSGGDWFFG